MDEDDFVPLIIALITCGVVWSSWYRSVFTVFAPDTHRSRRMALGCIPLASSVAVFFVLPLIADTQVANSVGYRLLFAATAALSLRVFFGALRWIALDPITGAIVSANPACIVVSTGVAAANLVLNLGANIGRGDTIASTLVPVGIGVGVLIGFGAVLVSITPLAEDAAGGRNLCAGCRFSALFIGASFPLFRSATGDWISGADTVFDMLTGAWPLLVLLGLGYLLERLWPADRQRTPVSAWFAGLIPGITFVAIAGALTWWPILAR